MKNKCQNRNKLKVLKFATFQLSHMKLWVGLFAFSLPNNQQAMMRCKYGAVRKLGFMG